MKISSQKAYGGAVGLALLAVILVAANVIVAKLRIRADLTAENLYTLSQGSRQVLSTLQEPVTLKYFFSRSSGDVDVFLKTYATQVENLLGEYVRSSSGKLTLEVYDPAPDSDDEEWAQKYGIEPQMLGMDVPPMYFGLAAVSADGETELSIPGFSPRTESTLEYEITRMITRVANPAKPVVGVLSTLPVLGEAQDPMASMGQRQPPSQPWYTFRELGRDSDVRKVETNATEIDADIRTLIVVHPKNLSEETLYAIDQFVMRGGRLIAFVDPLSIHDAMNSPQNPMMMGGPSFSSSMDRLFGAWGVVFESNKVVADMQYPTMLRGQSGPEENPAFLSLTKNAFNADDMLVSRWGSILLPFAGTFSISPREGITATHLIQTSDTAGLIDPMSAQFGAQAIRSQFVADGVNRTLAVRLNGAFKTAFPDGRPPRASADGEGAEEAEGVPAVADAAHRASGESVVVLFGDSDLLQDDVCVRINQSFGFSIPQVVSDNINLFVSAVEQASGDSALLAVRARGRTSRPYSVVDNLERKAQLAFLEKEKDLEEKLNATRQRLSEMQTQKTGRQRNILSTEQQAEIERFREEELRFRRELREVRKSLRHDIEVLGMRVKVLNILALPLLVGILGVGQGIRRRRVS